jgi:long-chain acyl-CoA synthetase
MQPVKKRQPRFACHLTALQAISNCGNYQVFTFDALLKLGAEKPAEPVPPSPEDLCTIMYTSGTTGE